VPCVATRMNSQPALATVAIGAERRCHHASTVHGHSGRASLARHRWAVRLGVASIGCGHAAGWGHLPAVPSGSSAQTLVLLPHHTVGTPFDNGTWALRKRVVTIDASGGQAPVIDCLEWGRVPPVISPINSADRGPRRVSPAQRLPEWRTPTWEQTWLSRSLFWAVRTSRA